MSKNKNKSLNLYYKIKTNENRNHITWYEVGNLTITFVPLGINKMTIIVC